MPLARARAGISATRKGQPMAAANRPSGAGHPTFAAALAYWFRLGCISFGGPAGQIALMQTDLVDRRQWIDQRSFLHALNFCMLLPGPEAQQLATFVGWRLHGVRGGLAAGILFILPGAVVLLALAWIAAAYGGVPVVAVVFDGVQPVVVGIIAVALWRLGRRTLNGWPALALAGAAFVGIHALDVPFPALVLGAGLVGAAAARLGSGAFGRPAAAAALDADPLPGPWRTVRLVVLFAVLWAVPVAAVLALLGTEPYAGIARLFTTAAFVTFGGAYAVLPYIAAAAVDTYGWLSAADMIRGLALAETTPGPLILVTQFVGFFAGWTAPAGLPPFAAGTVAAALTLYVTFLPCFLFIFAGAPYVERLGRSAAATAALGAITAAVVGVILNLGVFLAEAALLPAGRPEPVAAAVAVATAAVLLRWQVGVHWTVLAGAAFGLARAAVVGGV